MTGSLRRFVFAYIILHLLAVLVFLLVISPWLRNQLVNQTQLRMLSIATVIREHIRLSGATLAQAGLIDQLRPMVDGANVDLSLIDIDGNLLGDTSGKNQTDESRGDFPELRQAARESFGIDRRSDSSQDEPAIFLAIAYPGTPGQPLQGFVRISVDEQSITLVNTRLQQFVWIFTLSLAALAAVAMWSFASREMEPLHAFSIAARRIAAGQYDEIPAVLERNDEWRSLSDAFRHMQEELAIRENRLLENAQRLEAVLSSMIEGVIAIDAVGSVMLANRAACEMLGLDHARLMGRKLLELVRIPPLRQAIEHTQLNRVFGMVEFQTFDQPRKTISARVSVLTEGPQLGVAIVLHNITELRQLESIRSDFVANVSHELKTPLASIKAFAETLRLGAINDQANNMQFVQQIETHADLLNEQIMDLLQLAKIESGQALLEFVDVSLSEACEDAVTQHANEARDRKVALVFDGCGPEVVARADRDALLTIIDNLITNAIRYSSAGGQVRVSATRESNLAIIQVTDTGIGIAPEHQSRIFERFYRVDRARSRDLGGTGLGLSIVKHLTQALGGAVQVESRLGKGSTFRIKLPAPKMPISQ